MPDSNNTASLGCGTLILIALIVVIFGNNNTEQQQELKNLRAEIQLLKHEVHGLRVAVEAIPAK